MQTVSIIHMMFGISQSTAIYFNVKAFTKSKCSDLAGNEMENLATGLFHIGCIEYYMPFTPEGLDLN